MRTPSNSKSDSNRRNAMMSTGPRTASGKARSRFNARRHGLAAVPGENPPEVEQMTKVLCDEGSSPLRQQHAMTIAESQWMLCCVREARVALIESGEADHLPTELQRLERYERRAVSRLKRAIRAFMEAGRTSVFVARDNDSHHRRRRLGGNRRRPARAAP